MKADDVDGKKVYAITDAGRAFLDEHKGTVDDIFDRVGDTINRFIGDPMPEVNLAVGRVVAQAYRAAWKHGKDDASRKRIGEILERAAKELESVMG